MNFVSKTQEIVVTSRLNSGYNYIFGVHSKLNDLGCILLQKGRHIMSINSLGYDEHIVGATYIEKEKYE